MFSAKPIIDASLFRRLYAADPSSLPQIWAHRTATWRDKAGATASPRIDNRSNIHLAISDLAALKQELPLEFIERRGEVLIFKIDLKPHHLEGGFRDRGAAVEDQRGRKMGLRNGLGFDPVSGAPKKPDDGVPHIVLTRKPKAGTVH